MEGDDDFELGSVQDASGNQHAAASNSAYSVFSSDGHIWVTKVASSHERPHYLPHNRPHSRMKLVLALSSVQSNYLAISSGIQIFVFDLSARNLICTLPGIGRNVTSLAWSAHQPTLLGAGSIDGSICVWDLRTHIKPKQHIRAASKPCHGLAFNSVDENVLASIHSGTIFVWNLQHGLRSPARSIYEKGTFFQSLAWRPRHLGNIIAATADGAVRTYDLTDAITFQQSAQSFNRPTSDDESDDGVLGGLDDFRGMIQSISTINLETQFKDVHWTNENAIIGLSKHGHRVAVFSAPLDGNQLTRIWECEFESKAVAARIQKIHGTATLMAIHKDGIEAYDLPVDVLNSLGSFHEKHRSRSASEASPTKSWKDKQDAQPRMISTMKPVSISSQRKSGSGFSRTSKQLQKKRRLSRRASPPPRDTTSSKTNPPSNKTMDSPSHEPMKSSLELPKPKEEDDSPMPFISPGIPARRDSQSTMQALDDSILTLPPPSATLLEDSLPPAIPPVEQDSDDSDDEIFVDSMEGSATFLPGGINVPLPKACGALFAPNGNLVTFFPPKARPTSSHGVAAAVEDEAVEGGRRARNVRRLFPTFGNLITEPGWFQEQSDDSDSLASFSDDAGAADFVHSFGLQSSSFPSQHSWKTRGLSTRPVFNTQPTQHKVIVSVYDLNYASSILPGPPSLARKYRFLRDEGESGADVCEHNACAAEMAGLCDVAEIWRLLAMLLEDKVPLEVISSAPEDEDLLMVAQRARKLAQQDSGTERAHSIIPGDELGKLRWGGNPFGGIWLVRRIFQFAEDRADTQLLACISAVLSEATRHASNRSARVEDAFLKKLPTYSLDYFTDSVARTEPVNLRSRSIPVLRTNSTVNPSSMHESPVKTHRGSNSSSRNVSQPTTPYFDSTSSTPPLSLPSFSRQNTLLSISGSASPEHQRGSFSAAAKYYAQSITDKFSSYGTSPPIKKSGTSPSNNDLAASLPGGSWSKSVSFAASSATGTTTRGSMLAKSHEDQSFGEIYDSDKTPDEASLPHTPKSPSGAVMVMDKNKEAFSDEVSGRARESLLPDDLVLKGQIWCQCYAEQLRIRNLLEQAVELEKAMDLAQDTPPSHSANARHSETAGIAPASTRSNGTANTCTICFTVIRSLEEICPSCLHTSHLSCLVDYSAELSGDGEFTCPTGCGCDCFDLSFIVGEVRPCSPKDIATLKKKASFTDPRRWRARNEGDGW